MIQRDATSQGEDDRPSQRLGEVKKDLLEGDEAHPPTQAYWEITSARKAARKVGLPHSRISERPKLTALVVDVVPSVRPREWLGDNSHHLLVIRMDVAIIVGGVAEIALAQGGRVRDVSSFRVGVTEPHVEARNFKGPLGAPSGLERDQWLRSTVTLEHGGMFPGSRTETHGALGGMPRRLPRVATMPCVLSCLWTNASLEGPWVVEHASSVRPPQTT